MTVRAKRFYTESQCEREADIVIVTRLGFDPEYIAATGAQRRIREAEIEAEVWAELEDKYLILDR